MIKTALIIAPHPDDEINLAGQLMVKLRNCGIEIFVSYITNGDYLPGIDNKRIEEAIEANRVLGVDEDHVIFLGYANEWQENTHIFCERGPAVSFLGKIETNSISGHPEFCYIRHGIHHRFTRENLKNDIKELVVFIKPDLLIAPEFDAHPDHRAASLIFDEIMGEILKEDILYRPLIFKKSIHEGIWDGPDDYHKVPMLPTLSDGLRKYCGGEHELEFPSQKWSERIRLEADERTCTPLLKDNIVFKAARKHKLTTSWYKMLSVINADIVYWLRPTDNHMLTADISVSSGDGKYLNDFMRYGTRNILEFQEAFSDEAEFCWSPDKKDPQKTIHVHFPHKVRISEIRIFEDCNKKSHISKLQISVGEICRYVELNGEGLATVVEIPEQNTDTILFKVISGQEQMGIAEIEVFSKPLSFCYGDPFREYTERNVHPRTLLIQRVEKLLMMGEYLFSSKLCYEFGELTKALRKRTAPR